MYRGIRAKLPLGQLGFRGDSFPPPGYLTKAINVIIEDDKLRKIGGMTKFDTTALTGTPTCRGGYTWEPVIGQQSIITAWLNGKIHKEKAKDVDSVEIKDYAATLIGPAVFAEGGNESASENKKLFVFTEEQTPFYIDGTADTSSTLTASADWSGSHQPTSGLLHDSRMVAFGNANAPHTLYFTPLTDHTDFSTGGGAKVFDVFTGLGQEIRAAISLIGTRLYVLKYPYGIFYIDTSTVATATFLPATMVTDRIGIAGPKAWARVGTDIWFLDQNGNIRSLVAVESSIDLKDSNIGAALRLNQYIKDHVNVKRLKFAELLYDDANQILYISVTKKTSSTNNMRIIVNLQDPQVPRVTFDEDRGDFFETSFLYRDSSGQEKIYSAGAGGFVYVTNTLDRNVNGSAYTAKVRTPETGFEYIRPDLEDVDKRFDEMTLTMVGTNNSTVSVQPFIDGLPYGSAFTISIADQTANQIQDADGGFVFGDSTTSYFSNTTKIQHTQPIGGCGKRIAFEITQSGDNEDIKLIDAIVRFKPLGTEGES